MYHEFLFLKHLLSYFSEIQPQSADRWTQSTTYKTNFTCIHGGSRKSYDLFKRITLGHDVLGPAHNTVKTHADAEGKCSLLNGIKYDSKQTGAIIPQFESQFFHKDEAYCRNRHGNYKSLIK